MAVHACPSILARMNSQFPLRHVYVTKTHTHSSSQKVLISYARERSARRQIQNLNRNATNKSVDNKNITKDNRNVKCCRFVTQLRLRIQDLKVKIAQTLSATDN